MTRHCGCFDGVTWIHGVDSEDARRDILARTSDRLTPPYRRISTCHRCPEAPPGRVSGRAEMTSGRARRALSKAALICPASTQCSGAFVVEETCEIVFDGGSRSALAGTGPSDQRTSNACG